jgi:hypothetical protein
MAFGPWVDSRLLPRLAALVVVHFFIRRFCMATDHPKTTHIGLVYRLLFLSTDYRSATLSRRNSAPLGADEFRRMVALYIPADLRRLGGVKFLL